MDPKKNTYINKQNQALFIENLSSQAKELVSNPVLLIKLFKFLDRMDIDEMKEFEEFLDSIKMHQNILFSLQQTYMDLLITLLKSSKRDVYKSLFVNSLFKMGINLKNEVEENYFHIFLNLGKMVLKISMKRIPY